jgi:hypothetical protein
MEMLSMLRKLDDVVYLCTHVVKLVSMHHVPTHASIKPFSHSLTTFTTTNTIIILLTITITIVVIIIMGFIIVDINGAARNML